MDGHKVLGIKHQLSLGGNIFGVLGLESLQLSILGFNHYVCL